MQFTTVFIASITAIVTVNAAVLPVVNDNAEQSNALESRSYNAPTDDTNLEKRSPQYGGNGYQQQNRGNQGWNQGGMTAPSWQNGRGPNWQNGPGQNWQNGPGQNWQNGPGGNSGQNWQNGPGGMTGQTWQNNPWSGSGQGPIPNRRRY
ncbi:hypothetical protein BASA50_000960 [Batrachochytrium salamandrivorans]|uniref:Uncharacterized protein n=1 Tax=Batrachochytrium salamandrivorans TaxID=1357716 RepID=A0ABQ8EVE0_9FUNG|nr:hypothetical protein BASA50_000960 [Batrachochytrium salamandrivorans]KAH9275697.1 hypothetical protein BASA83_001997 [Batrachochytrium salamandrivorans]